MVLKFLTFAVDDNYLNTRPGSPPAFAPSPLVASPRVCSGCAGVISRFDESQLRSFKHEPTFSGRVKEASLLAKAVEVIDAIGGSMTSLNMNMSFMSRSTIKEKFISVLAFEVANTIKRGANLMQSLSEQNIVYLKEELLPSEGVQYLVSTDMDELLRIAAADQRKELQSFMKEVVRLGNQCKDPQFYNLDRYFNKMESRPAPGTLLRKDALAGMLPLMNLVQPTSELSLGLHALDRCEQDYWHKLQEHISLDDKGKKREFSRCDILVTDYGTFVTAFKLLASVYPWIVTTSVRENFLDTLANWLELESKHFDIDATANLSILRSELRSQRRHVKSLKKKSLWSRALEEVVEKLVDIILYLQLEVLKAFGSDACERTAGDSASNDRKLGSSGLDLHYASIITLIDNIVAHSGSVTPTMTDALYQSLPPNIKSAICFRLRQVEIQDEPTIPVIKDKMEKILSWLAPIAANTIKAHYGFARLGEWANMRSRVNRRPTGKGDFVRINTLYHADKEKTDPYIGELLFWLHLLVCKRRAMNDEATCSLDLTVSSLSNEEIRLSSHSLCKDVYKRKLMRRTSETPELEIENPYSCYYHLWSTGICDSPSNRSPGVPVPILKTLSMGFGIDMMTSLDVIDGITAP